MKSTRKVPALKDKNTFIKPEPGPARVPRVSVRDDEDPAAAMDPDELHHLMMSAVAADDARGLTRLIENYTNVWLDSPHSSSAEPMGNAALAALLSPHGPRCVEAFDNFFGDLRKWQFGRHGCVHWTVAYKCESGLAWALRPTRKDSSGYGRHTDRGLTLMDAEAPARLGGAGRSGLSIAVIRGDRKWLARVLEISEEAGHSVEYLAGEDKKSSISAIGVGLFECAELARAGEADGEASVGIQECVALLRGRGFPVDGLKPTIQIIAGLALVKAEEKTQNRAMNPVMLQAHEMGSGASAEHVPATPFEGAGFNLSLDWERALKDCGFYDPEGARFALGVRQRLARDTADTEHMDFSWMEGESGARKAAQIGAALRKSPARPELDPFGGMEGELFEWALGRSKRRINGTSYTADEQGFAAVIGEKLALARSLGLVSAAPARGPLRM